METKSKFFRAKLEHWGVYESSVISFVLNTLINGWETQTNGDDKTCKWNKMFSLFKSKKKIMEIFRNFTSIGWMSSVIARETVSSINSNHNIRANTLRCLFSPVSSELTKLTKDKPSHHYR